MGNEIEEFWHFIEDTVLKKRKWRRKKKHERALSVDLGHIVVAVFVSSF